ncbi:putative deacylase [Enterococcus sp. PF1-24]|uniref:M14 family metallopeptidase n=1 Tax=unclassified Enterococcus TaxID=2608891 RepID=UPI0024751709|nr:MULTISPECIES: M14 family metallopeptidase [unclassified Enterococcus]MDH6363245.1 putative deacylase [Enterococcus sp. PFB1-1]MDH6400454.1 putative deacylase [Enterococcus sp. PF1-24]
MIKPALNTKEMTYYSVPETDLQLPMIIIQGAEVGPTLLITAGIHGSEYAGMEACRRFAQEIDSRRLKGKIIILPCVNQPAFQAGTAFLNPLDQKNLNRCFPGNIEGTVSEKIAYYLEKDFFTAADFYLDLHSGDLPEALSPFVFIPTVGKTEVVAKAQKMAEVINVPYAVLSQAISGAYNYACKKSIPALLIERGGFGNCDEKDVFAFMEDIYRILSYLKMMNFSDQLPKEKNWQLLTTVVYEEAQYAGIWRPNYQVGDQVVAGAVLGVIENFFSKEIMCCYAKETGVLLYQWYRYSLPKGAPLFAYGNQG